MFPNINNGMRLARHLRTLAGDTRRFLMSPPSSLLRWRGARRFGDVVEYRYCVYQRPTWVRALCARCASQLLFTPDARPGLVFDEKSGGYSVLRGEIGGVIAGAGASPHCGLGVRSINWPEAAYFQVAVPEGIVWAWNEAFLPALMARVAGDKVVLRQILMRSGWDLARFIARVPRCAVVVRNRTGILARLKKLAAAIPVRAAEPNFAAVVRAAKRNR